MTSLKKTTLAAAFALVAVSTAHAAPIVTNGGFADGLSGWTVSAPLNIPGINTTPGIGVTTVTTDGTVSTPYGDVVPSFNGSTNAAYFVDDNAVESISQQITLTPDTEYTLSYALFATISGASNPFAFTLEDSVTGEDFATYNSVTNSSTITQVPVGVWTTETDTFTTGSGSDYTLTFDYNAGPTPAKDLLLTDVAIPEPVSLVLLGVGMIGTGIAARRRRQPAAVQTIA